MAHFTVQAREGETLDVTGRDGATLMKAIRKAGVAELTAQCGGGCACATCHVYVTLPGAASLPAIAPGESRMLATNSHRNLNSRLSCQIKLEPGLAGMHVVIAPEDLNQF